MEINTNFLKSIVDCLDKEWKVKDSNSSYDAGLMTDDGKRLNIQCNEYGSHKNRVTIYPHTTFTKEHIYLPDKLKVKEITCSVTKTPAEIARDIEKRILPQLNEALKYVRLQEKENREYEKRVKDITKQITDTLGSKSLYGYYPKPKGFPEYHHINIETTDKEMKIEIQVMPIKEGLELLKFYKSLIQRD